MNTKDLYDIGSIYGNILNGVKVVSEKVGPGAKDLNDKGAAKLQKGGPTEKGGFKKKKKLKGKENKFDSSKFTQEEDEEVVAESAKVLMESYAGGKRHSKGLIGQVVNMGRQGHLNTLRAIFHEMNQTNKEATINFLATIAEGNDPLYLECKSILKKVVAFDKQRKQFLTEQAQKPRNGRSLNLNTGTMKRSSFDKLFEAVMGGDDAAELDELGIDGAGGGEFDSLGSELEDDVADTVTLEIDRALAQQLYDLLGAVVGDALGGEDLGTEDLGGDLVEGGDLSGDGAFGDEDEETIGHAVHGTKPPESLTGKNNKVGNIKVASGKATSATTDKHGADGDWGHALHGAKAPDYGKNNKVGKLKNGQSFFNQ